MTLVIGSGAACAAGYAAPHQSGPMNNKQKGTNMKSVIRFFSDRAAVIDGIRKVGAEGISGVTGEIKLDDDGQRVWQPYQKLVVKDGKPTRVE